MSKPVKDKTSKPVKDKTRDEMLIDMLNYHLVRGNIEKDKVKEKYKDKIKESE